MEKGLRQEYIKRLQSPEKLEGSEVMEILLSNAYGGKDMSTLSKKLLERFPSCRAVLEADFAEIMSVDGMTESVALYLKTLWRTVVRTEATVDRIADTEDFLRLLGARMAYRDWEYAEMFLVDSGGKIVGVKSYTSGSAERVDVPVNRVVADIAASAAHGMYFAHNHVNCSVLPSAADDNFTQKLVAACKLKGMVFYDHCIVNSAGETFSYRQRGRLD